MGGRGDHLEQIAAQVVRGGAGDPHRDVGPGAQRLRAEVDELVLARATGQHRRVLAAGALDEELLAAFTSAGLDLAFAGRAAHAVRVHVLGAVAFDAAAAGRALDDEPEAEAPAATSDTLWDDLEAFPLSDRSRALADDPAERFAWSVERLLDGLLGRAVRP